VGGCDITVELADGRRALFADYDKLSTSAGRPSGGTADSQGAAAAPAAAQPHKEQQQ
jgi:hypothetical protein